MPVATRGSRNKPGVNATSVEIQGGDGNELLCPMKDLRKPSILRHIPSSAVSRSKIPLKAAKSSEFDIKEGLLSIPIILYVTSTSLISLARTSTVFREILLGRNTKEVWESDIGRDPDLPAVPQEMSEPQLVALSFANFCTWELHPFQGIIDQLDISSPSPSEPSSSLVHLYQTSPPPLPILYGFFPDWVELLGWDCIKESIKRRLR
ncbi:hypothetical protein BDV93DRAFT_610739 [Ceratobasidium sp. AG-I]|nr:hypothetical protein BDV93DRAFT_610739 [Ceratobasidium sp. AG-I]